MNFLKLGLFGVMGFAAFSLINRAKAAIAFEYDLLNFKMDKSRSSFSKGLAGTLNLSIYNPSTTDVVFDGFIGNIYYNGERVGNIDPTGNKATVKGRSKTVVPLNVVLPPSFFGTGIIALIDNLLSGKPINKTLELSGEAKIQGFPSIPVKQFFKI
jgi:LEA14-like dessication related protein